MTLSRSVTSRILSRRSASSCSHEHASFRIGPLPKLFIPQLYHATRVTAKRMSPVFASDAVLVDGRAKLRCRDSAVAV